MTDGPYGVVRDDNISPPWVIDGPGSDNLKPNQWNMREAAENTANLMNFAYREGQAARDADTGSWQPVETLLNSCAEQVSMTIRALQNAERALIKQAARVQGRREAEEE